MASSFRRPVLAAFAAALCAASLQASSGSPIVEAALRGDAATVHELIAAGKDVNAARGDGMTALHAAAGDGDAATVTALLDAGARVDATTSLLRWTPLDLAARNGHADVVGLLLKGGADPNAADQLGTTPLMMAAASGSAAAVRALLEAGADPDAKEAVRGETPLMFAAAAGRTEAVRALLDAGGDWRATTKVFDWTKLPKGDPRLASGDAHPPKKKAGAGEGAPDEHPDEAARAPQRRGAAPSGPAGEGPGPAAKAPASRVPRPPSYLELVRTQGGLTALMLAARQGHLDTVQAMVAHGVDVNEIDPGDHTTALMIAAVNGRFDVAMYLVQHGANPNLAQTNGAAPLYAVLNARWAPKSEYPNPLYYTGQQTDYLDLLAALLDHGADPNLRLNRKVWYTDQNNDQSGLDETGATPFWRAAYAADVDAMKLLAAHGADPTIPTSYPGQMPHYPPVTVEPKDESGLPPAALGGPSITPLLAASGEGYGWSFTANHHRFAPTGMLAAVRYLVEVLHADVNARDADGNTALHNAAARGDNEMIRYLVAKGADPTVVNRKGQTVADMANGPIQRVQPFPETIALLAKLGVPVKHPCVSC